MPGNRFGLVIALVACTACTDPPRTTAYGGDRPVKLQVPANFDASKHYPLTMILHGYSASGFVQEAYFDWSQLITGGETFALAPDGLIDHTGAEFWNADPECCDFDGLAPDDVGYLGNLIDRVSADWPIDRNAVLLIGHSNGGYMAYRMACSRSDIVKSVIVLAGNAASDPASCTPSHPVEVLHLHGTLDTEVPYAATAQRSVDQWSALDHCAGTYTAGPTVDVDYALPGAETTTKIADGCPTGVDVELWSIEGATHLPNIDATFAPIMWQWFTDHRHP